jgi:hypothetical protein
MTSNSNDYKNLLTEETLRNDLQPLLDVLDEDGDVVCHLDLSDFDDLNDEDIERWIQKWKADVSNNIDNCILEVSFNSGNEDFRPMIYVWYEEDQSIISPASLAFMENLVVAEMD